MYLGLDLGTTNVKAVVAERRGALVATGSAPVERFCTLDGGVEQDIEQIWNAVQAAVRMALRKQRPNTIRAIGISSQGAAIQWLDEQDAPQGRVLSWLDTRGQTFDIELNAELGPDFLARHLGHPASGLTMGQILRRRQQNAALVEPPHRLGFVGDLIVGRLCGRRTHDATSLAIAMLYNPWIDRADPDVMARLGIRDDQLPCLLPATTPAGVLQDSAASALGLPSGIPVSPAVHDQYAASLGAASVAAGDVNFGAGTAWVLLANTKDLSLPVTTAAHVCRHVVEGLYGQMLSMKNGGSAIDWVMSLHGNHRAVGESIDDSLDSIRPGCDGLRFWPFLSGGPETNGNGHPGGCLTGITLAHSHKHLIRAVVEGLACELLRHIRMLTDAGVPVNRVTMCGRAAAGRNTPQMIADILDLPVCCVETLEVSAFGAAMIARRLIEPDMQLAEIAMQWAPARRTVSPNRLASPYRDLLRDYFARWNHTEHAATP